MKMILPIIFMVTFLTFLIGIGHFAVYKTIIFTFNISSPRIINSIKILFFILFPSFILMNFIIQIGYSKIGAFFYELSAVWLGTLYLLFLAGVIIFIIFIINNFLGIPITLIKRIGILLIFTAFGLSIYGVINSFNIKITNYTLESKKLPDSWRGKNIVMFADSHFGNIRNVKFAEKLFKKINSQNPEIVVIAGDYYDGPPVNHKDIALLMKNIDSKRGIFFAQGNHEDYGKKDEFIESLSSVGVNVLDNRIITLDGVQIAGIDYDSGLTEQKIVKAVSEMEIKKELFKIFIKHVPSNYLKIEEAGFDLVFSGHAHLGQVPPGPWITRKMFKEFAYGLNYLNNMPIITTSGVGTWGPPQRIGTFSEIVVVRLENK